MQRPCGRVSWLYCWDDRRQQAAKAQRVREEGCGEGWQVETRFVGQQRSLGFIPIVPGIQVGKKYYPISTLNQNVRSLVFETL